MKLSIIIPVYNVEKYLHQCIDSVISQTFTDWELLLVDDGTPDNSGAICDQYANIDSRIKVFHKANGGVSSARNLGLDNAKGEWVTFVDADDFISPTFIEALVTPTIDYTDLDLVHGGCTNWKDGAPAGINQLYEDYIGTDSDFVFEKFRGLTVSKLFRLENVNHWSDGLPLRFDEEMKIAEDMAFTLDYLLTVKKYAFVSEVSYYYRIDNFQSATKQKQKRNYQDELHSYKHLYSSTKSYIDKHKLEKQSSLLRLSQRGNQLYYLCESICEEYKSVKENVWHYTNDLDANERYMIKFCKCGKLQIIISQFARLHLYYIFFTIIHIYIRLVRK